MPTLHRLATLRDDVIFFVWLYQGWKYKVDYTRVNEFGQGGEDEDEDEAVSKDDEEQDKILDQAETTDPVATRATGSSKASARKRK